VHCPAEKCRDHCDHPDSKSAWPHPRAPHCRRARTRKRLAASRTDSRAALVSQVQRADTLFNPSAGADGLLDVCHKGGRAQAHRGGPVALPKSLSNLPCASCGLVRDSAPLEVEGCGNSTCSQTTRRSEAAAAFPVAAVRPQEIRAASAGLHPGEHLGPLDLGRQGVAIVGIAGMRWRPGSGRRSSSTADRPSVAAAGPGVRRRLRCWTIHIRVTRTPCGLASGSNMQLERVGTRSQSRMGPDLLRGIQRQ
jgi:hypothetical protein